MARKIYVNLFLVLVSCLLSCRVEHKKVEIKKSNTFFLKLRRTPENMHPIRSTDFYSGLLRRYILESLLKRDLNSYEWQPSLAKKWSLSSDKKTFVFEIHENLKWSDGKPLTVEDIKFSFDAYRNPEYGGIRKLPSFENMEMAEILGDQKIQFKVKRSYFRNFSVIAQMPIIPQHIYKDPRAKVSKTLLGSGPYMIEEYVHGKIIVLKKNPFWEARKNPLDQGQWSFEKIAFRIILEDTDSLLRMEKGDLDFVDIPPKLFFENTNHSPWGETIRKVQFQNKRPSYFGYIGLNMKNPLFQDKRVRKALAHLFNRRLINKKFHYNQMELAKGPWYFWSDYADPSVSAIEFDPQRARALLKLAGWRDKDKNGVLEKKIQGQTRELAFKILFSNPASEKYLTLYQQDLKRAGIQIKLQTLDWASFLRLVRKKQFDAMLLSWSGSIDIDPKPVWHSESAQENGANYISYSNPRVDKLIDRGRSQLNRNERIQTFRKVYKLIAEDVPYIFIFNRRTYILWCE